MNLKEALNKLFDNLFIKKPDNISNAPAAKDTDMETWVDENIWKNPTTAKPKITLYGIKHNLFDTKQELEAFCKEKDYSIDETYKLDYIGNFAGKTDVIRISYGDLSMVCTATTIDSYEAYNWNWETYQGDLMIYHRALRERGIVFSNDVYAEAEKTLDQIYRTKTVYGIGDNFFDTLDELRAFCGANNRSTTGWFKLDYLGDYEGKKDVIRTWNSSSMTSNIFSVPVPTEEQNLDWNMFCYEMYDQRERRWKLCQGNLITYYRTLRERGVKFSNDPYAKVEEFLVEVHERQPETGGRQFTIGTHPATQQ